MSRIDVHSWMNRTEALLAREHRCDQHCPACCNEAAVLLREALTRARDGAAAGLSTVGGQYRALAVTSSLPPDLRIRVDADGRLILSSGICHVAIDLRHLRDRPSITMAEAMLAYLGPALEQLRTRPSIPPCGGWK